MLQVALVIRGVTSGHVPAQPFILVSMASTLVLLVGWRAAATAIFPNDKPSNDTLTGNKKGSIFELFQVSQLALVPGSHFLWFWLNITITNTQCIDMQLLSSLVRRW